MGSRPLYWCVGAAAPFAERARVQAGVFAAAEDESLERDARRHARAAVDGDLGRVAQACRQRLLEEGVPRTGDPPGDGVERLDVTAPALRRPRVREDERGVTEARPDLLDRDRVVGALAGYEFGRIDVRLRAIERSRVRPEVERPRPLVPEVAQQPPAALRPAVARVVREHECLGADAGT